MEINLENVDKLLMNVKSQLFNWQTAFIIMTNLTAAATAAVH